MINNTQAHEVAKRLEKQFNFAPNNNYLSTKKYLMLCHGCGKLHVEESCFISVPMAMSIEFPDKSFLSVPCSGCASCMADPAKPIRQAWQNGMTKEAVAAAYAACGVEVPTK